MIYTGPQGGAIRSASLCPPIRSSRGKAAVVYGRVYATHDICGDPPFISTFWESGSADIHALDGGSDTSTRGDGTHPGYIIFPTGDNRSQSRYLITTGVVHLTVTDSGGGVTNVWLRTIVKKHKHSGAVKYKATDLSSDGATWTPSYLYTMSDVGFVTEVGAGGTYGGDLGDWAVFIGGNEASFFNSAPDGSYGAYLHGIAWSVTATISSYS